VVLRLMVLPGGVPSGVRPLSARVAYPPEVWVWLRWGCGLRVCFPSFPHFSL